VRQRRGPRSACQPVGLEGGDTKLRGAGDRASRTIGGTRGNRLWVTPLGGDVGLRLGISTAMAEAAKAHPNAWTCEAYAREGV